MNIDEQTIEVLVTASLNTAQKMIEECGRVVPCGVSIDCKSKDVKISCYREDHPDAEWMELIEITVRKLSEGIDPESETRVFAIVTSLENGDDRAVGLQVETPESCKLFVYPYQVRGELVTINEPLPMDNLIAPRIFEKQSPVA